MCHMWVRNQCTYKETDGACPKGHHWYYSAEDNTSSDKDPLLVAMQQGCKRLRQEHAVGQTSADDIKEKKKKLLLLFHPDKAPLKEVEETFTEVTKILNTELNLPV